MVGKVSTCPKIKKDWENRAAVMKNCNFTYHCLPDYNGVHREVCIERTSLTGDPVCFQNLFKDQRDSRNPERTTFDTAQSPSEKVNIAAVVISLLGIAIILILVVLAVAYWKNYCGLRDRFRRSTILRGLGCIGNSQESGPLEGVAFLPNQATTPTQGKKTFKDNRNVESEKKLEAVNKLYSLVLFLKELPKKCNIDIKEIVKETKYLYKKSFMNDLNSAEVQGLETEDFKVLTNSTVFIFLTNLCGFEKPTKGWESKPFDKDVSLEADIARIRILWNGMCDGDVDEKMIRETFERLRIKYGEMPIENVENMGSKEKINWKPLKPDCEGGKDFVLTKKVNYIIQKLEEMGLVVCSGAIGSGKSEALKYVAEKYRKEGWKVEWTEKIPLPTYKQKVLLCCDNLFGEVAYEYFTLEQLKSIKELLEECSQCQGDSKTKKFKLLVSVHNHVLQELEKDRRENFQSLKNRNFTVEMDRLKSAELYLIFKTTIEKGCSSHKDCWYKKNDFSPVDTKLKSNSGKVGDPFLLMALAKNHNLFNEAFPTKTIDFLVRNKEFPKLKIR
ncbi:uncharacterized protein LOC134232722 isoform X2 [Saccostrea cucullata]|uniref:uncharacterized protein LOC134232722 isoform X2 n=1 Tax=Saccostrea cuccullata TaxID=36930 RepID=UPI002ED4CAA6